MAEHEERGADLPQRDAGGRRTSEPGRTGRFAHPVGAGDEPVAEGYARRTASDTHRVDEASGTRH